MSEKKIYYICHRWYGCDTGCCGHTLCLDPEGDEEVPGSDFEFMHAPESRDSGDPDMDVLRTYAEQHWAEYLDDNIEVQPGDNYKC